MNEDLVIGDFYLVSINDKLRIAKFNGFQIGEGHFEKDWLGDSGSEWDAWMHEDIEGYLPLKKFNISINGDTKRITSIFLST